MAQWYDAAWYVVNHQTHLIGALAAKRHPTYIINRWLQPDHQSYSCAPNKNAANTDARAVARSLNRF